MTKATLITRGGLGNIIVQHITLLDHGRKPYAQYKSAPFVNYKKKGGRKALGFIEAYAPYIVILKGWQEINTQEAFKPVVTSNGVTTSEGKYNSVDSHWESEFESDNEFNEIIADYRGVNAHEVI